MQTSELTLMALEFKNGTYQPIRTGLRWELIHEKLKTIGNQPMTSADAEPQFSVISGLYQLVVEWGKKKQTISDIQLIAGKRTSQIVLFGETAELQSGESYAIAEEAINAESEYARRQLERSGERQFGLAANGLTQPTKQQGQGMGLAAHPLLSQSAQFDGMAAKMNPVPNENPAAAENAAEKAPHLAPSPSPAPAPGMTPTPLPR